VPPSLPPFLPNPSPPQTNGDVRETRLPPSPSSMFMFVAHLRSFFHPYAWFSQYSQTPHWHPIGKTTSLPSGASFAYVTPTRTNYHWLPENPVPPSVTQFFPTTEGFLLRKSDLATPWLSAQLNYHKPSPYPL